MMMLSGFESFQVNSRSAYKRIQSLHAVYHVTHVLCNEVQKPDTRKEARLVRDLRLQFADRIK